MTCLAHKLLADTGYDRSEPSSIHGINLIPGNQFVKYLIVSCLF